MSKQTRRFLWIALAALLFLVGCQASANPQDSNSEAYGPALPPGAAQPAPTATSAGPILATVAEVSRISPKEVRDLQMVGQPVVIVDSRDLQYYEQGHIRGAISLPTDEVEIRYRELPQDTKIVFYCT